MDKPQRRLWENDEGTYYVQADKPRTNGFLTASVEFGSPSDNDDTSATTMRVAQKDHKLYLLSVSKNAPVGHVAITGEASDGTVVARGFYPKDKSVDVVLGNVPEVVMVYLYSTPRRLVRMVCLCRLFLSLKQSMVLL